MFIPSAPTRPPLTFLFFFCNERSRRQSLLTKQKWRNHQAVTLLCAVFTSIPWNTFLFDVPPFARAVQDSFYEASIERRPCSAVMRSGPHLVCPSRSASPVFPSHLFWSLDMGGNDLLSRSFSSGSYIAHRKFYRDWSRSRPQPPSLFQNFVPPTLP